MAHLSFSNIAVAAMATAVPEHVQTLDLSIKTVKKYAKQMGFLHRHITITEQTGLDYSLKAVKCALERAGWDKDSLDVVIVDVQAPDIYGGTGNAIFLHRYLDLPEKCAAFDMTVGCAAFPYALANACNYLQQPDIHRVALVVMSACEYKMYNSVEDLQNCKNFMFGEAASAVLLEKRDNQEVIDINLFAQGAGADALFYSQPMPCKAWQIQNMESCIKLFMNGVRIYEFSVDFIPGEIKRLYGDTIHQFDYCVFHQANQMSLDQIQINLGLEPDKVLSSVEEYGNTSEASVPVTICSRLYGKRSLLNLFCASFGIGLTWGFIKMHLDPAVICPVATVTERLPRFIDNFDFENNRFIEKE